MAAKILFGINQENEVEIQTDFHRFCESSVWRKAKIIPVCIAGAARQGKSTLLNLLYYITTMNKSTIIPNIFNAEYTEYGDSVTQGVLFNPNLIPIR